MLSAVGAACPVPVAGVVSNGQHSIRKAVATVFLGVAHQLRQFYYLREAGLLIYEKDRHAKRELKKSVRHVRGIARQTGVRIDPDAGAFGATARRYATPQRTTGVRHWTRPG